MIVIAHRRRNRAPQTSDAAFERMLPAIREQARLAFRFARPELKEELIAETIANAFCAFVRLVERGKEDIAYATPLAGYAIRQVCAGRCVGTKLNVSDVSSRYAQRANGITVERLDQFDSAEGQWREALVEDRRAGPADTAVARLDMAAWLRSLGRKRRRIAQILAKGETTGTVARMFGLTAGRVSQLRQELRKSWQEFQGEAVFA